MSRAFWITVLGVTCTLCTAALILVGVAMARSADDGQSTGLPPCTDYVAEHGGMCEGPLLPECPTEDSDNCAWDAIRMGNGTGRSFYVIDGEVTYTTD